MEQLSLEYFGTLQHLEVEGASTSSSESSPAASTPLPAVDDVIFGSQRVNAKSQTPYTDATQVRERKGKRVAAFQGQTKKMESHASTKTFRFDKFSLNLGDVNNVLNCNCANGVLYPFSPDVSAGKRLRLLHLLRSVWLIKKPHFCGWHPILPPFKSRFQPSGFQIIPFSFFFFCRPKSTLWITSNVPWMLSWFGLKSNEEESSNSNRTFTMRRCLRVWEDVGSSWVMSRGGLSLRKRKDSDSCILWSIRIINTGPGRERGRELEIDIEFIIFSMKKVHACL